MLVIKKLGLDHVLSNDWEQRTRKRYREQFNEMVNLFGTRISLGMEMHKGWSEPMVQSYLTRIIIDNLTFVGKSEQLGHALARRHVGKYCYLMKEEVRCWEEAGEVVLLYSALFSDNGLSDKGIESFHNAHALIADFSRKSKLTDELRTRQYLDEYAEDNFFDLAVVLGYSKLDDLDLMQYLH